MFIIPLPTNLYNFISFYGKTGFQNEKYNILGIEYSRLLGKYGFDDGYRNEELNIINLMQNIEKNKYTINLKAMYYISPNAITKRIINEPENYSIRNQKKRR